MLQIENQVAIVTGAANGIGRAIVERFVAEGVRVVAVDLDAAQLCETARQIDPDIVTVPADISIRTQVQEAVRIAIAKFGQLDIVAANAGIADGQSFLDIDDASWKRIIDVNVTGTFYCVQEGAREMAKARKGAIVCTSSTNAWYVEKNLAHYNTSKGGVEALVRSAAIDLAEFGIRVNAVEPSMVKTRAAFITEDSIGGPEYLRRVPMGRFADPSEIAAAVAWLASGQSSYITGQTLILDGGLTLGIDIPLPTTPLPGICSIRNGHMIDRRTLIATSFASSLAFRRNIRAQEPLRALGWTGYVDQGTLDRFKTATGIEVVVDSVGSYDEIFLRLRSGGLNRYSLIAPHHGLIGTLRQEGLIQAIDLTQVPSFDKIDSRFELPATTEIGSDRFAVPLLFGTSPCIYNADLLPEPPAAWTDLDSDAFTGKVGMLDDGLSHFFVAGRAAGSTTAPYLSRTEMARTTELLTDLKRNRVSHFTPYPSDLVAMLKSGKCAISTTGWEGMTLLPEASGSNLQIARMAPGDFSFVQTFAITSEAPMVSAAHQFIEFMLSVEEQAALANRTVRGVVNQDAVELIEAPIRRLTEYSNLDAVFSQSPILDFPPLTETVDGAATYLDWVVSWEAIRLTTSNAAP